MKLAADTNWLQAIYFESARSPIVDRFLRRHGLPLFVSAPVLLECRNVFSRIAGEGRPAEWDHLESDLGSRIQRLPLSWEEIAVAAEELIGRFSTQATIGTLDLAIVAAARAGEATHFLSFDSQSGARALAGALRLEVFPALTPAEREQMAAFKRS